MNQADDAEKNDRDNQQTPFALRILHPCIPLLEVLRFLTLLPLPELPPSDAARGRLLAWFPVAGLVIGALLLPVGWLAGGAWDAGVRTAVIIVVWGIVTAGMHFDGLADTFDAVMSWRSRERKLEIMKDSRIGTMGVLAIGAVLLLKFAWLQAAGEAWWQAALLAPVWGRWCMTYGLAGFPAARTTGLGHTFKQQVQPRTLLHATLAAVLLALLIGQVHGLLAGLLVWGGATLLARWWVRDLGGLTGDSYGALCELGEVVVLAVIAL